MGKTHREDPEDLDDIAPDQNLDEGDAPPATTAGQEDHSDPTRYTGPTADAPPDTGRPPESRL